MTLETVDGICGVINSWRKCGKNFWEKPGPHQTKERLSSIEAVLASEKIEIRDYRRWISFLKDHEMTTLNVWRANPPPGLPSGLSHGQDCVQFENATTGLRYENGPKPLAKDSEYLAVESLGRQWFLYNRDWN